MMKSPHRGDHLCALTIFSTPSQTQQALDEKFAAIEEKDNEIHQLQLSLRERERDLDRLNNLLSHSEETINVNHSNPFCPFRKPMVFPAAGVKLEPSFLAEF